MSEQTNRPGMSLTNILLLILVIFFVGPWVLCGMCSVGTCAICGHAAMDASTDAPRRERVERSRQAAEGCILESFPWHNNDTDHVVVSGVNVCLYAVKLIGIGTIIALVVIYYRRQKRQDLRAGGLPRNGDEGRDDGE